MYCFAANAGRRLSVDEDSSCVGAGAGAGWAALGVFMLAEQSIGGRNGIKGVSQEEEGLVYGQECIAEERRRRR